VTFVPPTELHIKALLPKHPLEHLRVHLFTSPLMTGWVKTSPLDRPTSKVTQRLRVPHVTLGLCHADGILYWLLLSDAMQFLVSCLLLQCFSVHWDLSALSHGFYW